jgi:hypothetical protein
MSIGSTSGTVLGYSWPEGGSKSFFVYDIDTSTINDITSTDGVQPVYWLRNINNQGNIVGEDNSGIDGFAFQLEKTDGTYTRTYFNYPYPGGTPPDRGGTSVRGINDSNHVAGFFNDPTRIYHYIDFWGNPAQYPRLRGYLATDITDPSSYVPIDVPGAFETLAMDINNLDWVTGLYYTSPESGASRTFLFDGTYYVDLYVNDPDPDVDRTEARGLNDNGDIVGTVGDSFTFWDGYGFLYSQDDNAFYKVLFPGSNATHLHGIDNLGIIVGTYATGRDTYHGFFAVPDSVVIPGLEGGVVGTLAQIDGTYAVVPEPSTILLLGFGLAGVGLLRRRFKQ